jgi:hypothetical protein
MKFIKWKKLLNHARLFQKFNLINILTFLICYVWVQTDLTQQVSLTREILFNWNKSRTMNIKFKLRTCAK